MIVFALKATAHPAAMSSCSCFAGAAKSRFLSRALRRLVPDFRAQRVRDDHERDLPQALPLK
jgi:hypothetical protein